MHLSSLIFAPFRGKLLQFRYKVLKSPNLELCPWTRYVRSKSFGESAHTRRSTCWLSLPLISTIFIMTVSNSILNMQDFPGWAQYLHVFILSWLKHEFLFFWKIFNISQTNPSVFKRQIMKRLSSRKRTLLSHDNNMNRLSLTRNYEMFKADGPEFTFCARI